MADVARGDCEMPISDVEYEDFVRMHAAQLRATGIPEYLWYSLCLKLSTEVGSLKMFLTNLTF